MTWKTEKTIFGILVIIGSEKYVRQLTAFERCKSLRFGKGEVFKTEALN